MPDILPCCGLPVTSANSRSRNTVVAIEKSSVPLGEKSSSAVLDRAMTHPQHHYLFQMPRWDKRLRIVLDWTVALFFRPDITKVGLEVEREQVRRSLQMAGRSIETGRGAT